MKVTHILIFSVQIHLKNQSTNYINVGQILRPKNDQKLTKNCPKLVQNLLKIEVKIDDDGEWVMEGVLGGF